MEGYGYGRVRGGNGGGRGGGDGNGRGGGRGRDRGRGGGGGRGGGRGRGNQQYSNNNNNNNYQQSQSQGPPQQQRTYQQGSQWRSGPVNTGRDGPNPNYGYGGGNEGSSRGQPKSNTVSYADKFRSSNQSGVDRGLVPKMQSMKLSEGSSSKSSTPTEALVPIRRPDQGGLARTRLVNILVNHFPVKFNPESTIWHYDIDIKPEQGSSKGRPTKISKANLSLLMEKLFSDNPGFPLEMSGFDGEKNVFSAVRLPVGKFTVRLSDEEMRSNSFIFTVTLVNELKLHKLKSYLTGEVLQLPREVLQGMDVVMKENPRRHMVGIGRTFHPTDSRGQPLGHGLEASEGFQHSLKPTSQGLALCLDYSVLAVRMKMPVLDFLREHLELREFTMRSFNNCWRNIESALKGLKVTVTHRRTKQKYIVSGLTKERACDISFVVDDTESGQAGSSIRLLDYFQEKYPNLVIEHGDLPCLSLGRGKRPNYVPIELCVLVEGQRYPKENLDFNSARLLKNISLAHPEDRRKKICSMLRDENGPCGGEISKNFEIDVTMDMTRVRGRVLEPPKLKLMSQAREILVDVDKFNCQWNLVNKSVPEGATLKHWAVIDFSAYERYDRLNNNVIPMLVDRCNRLGMQMAKPLFIKQSGMRVLSSAESLTPLLEEVQNESRKASQGNELQLILCVMSRKDNGYKFIKWVSEIKIGMLTQCCLSKSANKCQDQYFAQLGMKINAKLGGSNAELYNQLPLFETGGHVMVIGADVNHPRPMDLGSPSVAAVVGSMNWPGATKYNPRVNFQGHRVEEIQDFGRICLNLVLSYEKVNGVKPEKLVIFRDGVSEAQLDMVLNKELWDLKRVFEERNYRPTVTLIVARKRHQTRLFPESGKDGGKSGNIPPGTVVDTTIVHPLEFDFYLCSHYGGIGTSKPTHYFVPYDEHNFSSDELQHFIYYLCFMFARCTKPVSLVPPVYYADLLAYRGRLYYDAQTETMGSSGRSSSSSMTSSSLSSANVSDVNVVISDVNGLYFI